MKMALVLALLSVSPVAALASGNVIATCNNGDLEVVHGVDGIQVVVNNAGVARWFIEQSKTCYQAQVDSSPYGGAGTFPVTVCRKFPWMVKVANEGSQLVIGDFHAYEDGRFLTSGPGGVTLEPNGEGMNLTISGGMMPSSHSLVYYTVGNWFFESCGKP